MTRAEQKQATKERLLEAASRRLKTQGIKGTSVQSVMGDANLTHGAFYAYFDDKEQMVAETLRWSVEQSHRRVQAMLPPAASARERLSGFLRFYLSPQHRAAVAEGCPIASLSRDFAQTSPKFRHEFAKGMTATIDHRRKLFSRPEAPLSRETWMAAMSTYVGALVLSRACEGEPLSDQFLEAAHNFLEEALFKGDEQ